MNITLISTYELGHQPFGLASPAAWLAEAGAQVTCVDLAVQSLRAEDIAKADLIAFYLPMHTATRLAIPVIEQVKQINPQASLCCYGLYAPVNAGLLRDLGVDTILGGEFEEELVAWYRWETKDEGRKTEDDRPTGDEGPRAEDGGPRTEERQRISNLQSPISDPSATLRTSLQSPRATDNNRSTIDHGPRTTDHRPLPKLQFRIPDRSGLPGLAAYAWVKMPDGTRQMSGYTEASRGCKHLCRHCPIVPVYGGQFRIVQKDVVLADVRQQFAAGARHITFGDPDFFNGPGHAIPIVQALHIEFPDLTYDVTIKIEHLLKHAEHLPTLRDTGCLFVTSAVESVDDRILDIFDKRHTRADFIRTVQMCRELGLMLNPTFVTFTPWTTQQGYRDLLRVIAQLDLIEHVAPIQYAIRLLIPQGSKLLELPEVRELIDPFDAAALSYPWRHPDPHMDRLYDTVRRAVQRGQARGESRWSLFETVWKLAEATDAARARPTLPQYDLARKPIPHLSEPWYC